MLRDIDFYVFLSVIFAMDFFNKFSKLFNLTLSPGSILKNWFKKLRNRSKFSFLVLPEYTGEEAIIEEIADKYKGKIYPFKFSRLTQFLADDAEKEEYETLKKEISEDIHPDLLASSLYERITSRLISNLFEAIGSHIKGKKILFVCSPIEFRTLKVQQKKVVYASITEEIYKGTILPNLDAEQKNKVSEQKNEILQIKLKDIHSNFLQYETPEQIVAYIGRILKVKSVKA